MKSVEKYVRERRKLVRGIDIETIHGLHAGDDERECELRLSDIEEMLRRLAVAQRLADALERLLSSHKDFMWCASQTPPRVPDLGWSQEIEDEARAVAAEWKALQ